jgi:hypothetical protein
MDRQTTGKVILVICVICDRALITRSCWCCSNGGLRLYERLHGSSPGLADAKTCVFVEVYFEPTESLV